MGINSSAGKDLLSEVGAFGKWALGYSFVIVFDSPLVAVDGGTGFSPTDQMTFFAFVLGILYGSAVVFPNAIGRLVSSDRALLAVSATGALGVLAPVFAATFARGIPVDMILVASLVGMGFFQAIFTLAFLSLFSRCAMPVVLVALLACHLCASAFVLLLQLFADSTTASFFLMFFPFATFYFCRRLRITVSCAEHGVCREDAEDAGDVLRAAIPPMIVWAVVMFAVGLVRSLIPTDLQGVSYIGMLLAAALVAALIMGSGKVVRFRFLYDATVVLLTLGLFCLAIGGATAWAVSSVLTNAGYVLFTVFAVALLCSICQRYGGRPIRVFGIANLITLITYGAGGLIGMYFRGESSYHIAVLAFLVACVLFAAFLLAVAD